MEAGRMNAEYAVNNYKKWVVRKNILYVQLKSFVGITEREYIEKQEVAKQAEISAPTNNEHSVNDIMERLETIKKYI